MTQTAIVNQLKFNCGPSFFNILKISLKKAKRELTAHSQTILKRYGYTTYSPETLKLIPYDSKLSNFWAIGIILYAMLFGQ